MKRINFQLEISIRSDFADLFEVKSGNIVRRGRIATEWSQARPTAFARSIATAISSSAVAISAHIVHKEAVYANGRLSFEVELQPGERWHTCLLYTLKGQRCGRFGPPRNCIDTIQSRATQRPWRIGCRPLQRLRPAMRSSIVCFGAHLKTWLRFAYRSKWPDHSAFMPAAGLPWFVAPFGRDSLLVSLQNILIYPHFARGSVGISSALFRRRTMIPTEMLSQARYLHELRCGELAHFKLVPHTPYYGTADATPLYLITLHAAWRATGDKALTGAAS